MVYTACLNPYADTLPQLSRIPAAQASPGARASDYIVPTRSVGRTSCVSHMIAPVSYPHVSRPQTQRSSETSPSEPILGRRPIRAHRSRTVRRGDLAICRAGKGAHAEIEGSYSLRKPGITDALVDVVVQRATARAHSMVGERMDALGRISKGPAFIALP